MVEKVQDAAHGSRAARASDVESERQETTTATPRSDSGHRTQ